MIVKSDLIKAHQVEVDFLPKILVVSNRYRPIIGGSEKQCENLCAQLANRVRWIAILTHRYAPELESYDFVDGIPVIRLGRPLNRGRVIPIAFYLELAIELIKKRNEFDLIHCHNAGLTGLWVASICRLIRRPALLKLSAEGELRQQVVPSYTKVKSTFIILKNVFRKILSGIAVASPTTHLVALTQGGYKEALYCGVQKIYLIPNGVDTLKYSANKSNHQNKLGIVRFGYAGRLSEEKGTHLLVDAFSTLLQTHSNLLFSIAGSGNNQLKSSEEKIANLQKHWPHRVEHVGVVSDSVSFLSNLDVYISASNYEGLPNSVLEALAVGLPCLLSNIEAHREILRLNPKATIFFFEPNHLDSLICSVSNILTKWPCDRSVLSSNLDIKIISNNYLDLYKNIIEMHNE